MKKYLLLVPFIFILSGCASPTQSNEVMSDAVVTPTLVTETQENESTMVQDAKPVVKDPTAAKMPSVTIVPQTAENNEFIALEDELSKSNLVTLSRQDNPELFDKVCSVLEGSWYSTDFYQSIGKRENITTKYQGITFEFDKASNECIVTNRNCMVASSAVVSSFELDMPAGYITINGKYFGEDKKEFEAYRLALHYGNMLGSDIEYYKCDEISDFINGEHLVGEYADEAGDSYTFKDDLTAVWPDHNFSYITFDGTLFPYCNPIIVVDKSGVPTGEYYGYRLVDESLLIYNVDAANDYIPVGETLAVLHRKTIE